MILSKSKEDRSNALEKILPYQKEDFKKIFKVMSGVRNSSIIGPSITRISAEVSKR